MVPVKKKDGSVRWAVDYLLPNSLHQPPWPVPVGAHALWARDRALSIFEIYPGHPEPAEDQLTAKASLDDILLYHNSLDEHLERLAQVFQAHREGGIILKPSKTFRGLAPIGGARRNLPARTRPRVSAPWEEGPLPDPLVPAREIHDRAPLPVEWAPEQDERMSTGSREPDNPDLPPEIEDEWMETQGPLPPLGGHRRPDDREDWEEVKRRKDTLRGS